MNNLYLEQNAPNPNVNALEKTIIAISVRHLFILHRCRDENSMSWWFSALVPSLSVSVCASPAHPPRHRFLILGTPKSEKRSFNICQAFVVRWIIYLPLLNHNPIQVPCIIHPIRIDECRCPLLMKLVCVTGGLFAALPNTTMKSRP